MMKTIWILCVLLSLLQAQSSKDLLRDALFAEESEGDLQTAAANYQSILESYSEERKIAAIALYRLAEVQRKQGRRDEAIRSYQEYLARFAEIEPQGGLVRENLKALGEKIPVAAETILTEEAEEIARLKRLKQTSPDLYREEKHLIEAVKGNQLKVAGYLLNDGFQGEADGMLWEAVEQGNKAMAQLLLDHGATFETKKNRGALMKAAEKGYWELFNYLVSRGADVGKLAPHCLIPAIAQGRELALINALIAQGARVDGSLKITATRSHKLNGKDRKRTLVTHTTPIVEAALHGRSDLVDRFLSAGVSPNHRTENAKLTALHAACLRNDLPLLKKLHQAGGEISQLVISLTNGSLRNSFSYGNSSLPRFSVTSETVEALVYLMEAGAKGNQEFLRLATEVGVLKLVKLCVEQGVSLKYEWGDRHTPLESALRERREEVADYLISAGISLTAQSFEEATPQRRRQLYEKESYPHMAKQEKVFFVCPEFAPEDFMRGSSEKLALNPDGLLDLSLPFWTSRDGRSHAGQHFKMSLYRKGERTSLISEAGEVLKFEPGDIIEFTGLYPPSNPDSRPNERILKELPLGHIPHPGAFSLFSAYSIPFTIDLDGVKMSCRLRRDRLTYDPRTTDFPMGSVHDVLEWLELPSQVLKGVVFERSDGPAFPLMVGGVFQDHEIGFNDKITITTMVDLEDPNNKITLNIKETTFSRSWLATDWNRPTLYQLLAELNHPLRLLGVELPPGWRGFPSLLDPESSLEEEWKRRIMLSYDRYPKRTAFHGINLRKIQVTTPGQGASTIDLVEIAKNWISGGSDKSSLELPILPGSLVELEFLEKIDEEDLEEISEVNRLMSDTLKTSIIIREMGRERIQDCGWNAPRWVEVAGGWIPSLPESEQMTLSDGGLPEGSYYLVYRGGGAESVNQSPRQVNSGAPYWPRSGDRVELVSMVPKPGDPVSTEVEAAKKRRTRYVPRPPKGIAPHRLDRTEGEVPGLSNEQ